MSFTVGQLGTCAHLRNVIIAVVMALIGLMNPSARAELLRLEYVSVRGGVTGYVIGQYQPEYFNQFDVALATRLPLEKEIGDNWVLGTRVLLTGGALVGTLRRGRGRRGRREDPGSGVGAPSSGAVELLGREHQARGRTRPRPRLDALARARVDTGVA